MIGSSPTPTFQGGLARERGESKYPHLWDRLEGLYVPFASPPGSIVYDLSGKRRNGTLGGGTVYTVTPKGWGFLFDGTDDTAVNLAITHNIGTGDFTMLADVLAVRVTTNYESIASIGSFNPNMAVKAGPASANWGLYFGSELASGNTLSTMRWYQLAVMRRGSTISFFQDGVQTPTTHTNSTSIGNDTFRLGFNGLVSYLSGQISNFAFYSRALTPSEIIGYYRGEHPLILRDRRVALSSGGAALTLELSDSISVSDSPVKDASKPLSDALELADAIAKLTGKSLSESMAVVDALALLSGKSLSDTVTITDSIVQAFSKALEDSISISDVIAKLSDKPFSDSFSVSDSTVKSVGKAISESVEVSDGIAKLAGKAFSDTLSLSDSMSAVILLTSALADAFSATDSIALVLQIVAPSGSPSVPSLDICGDITRRSGAAYGQAASTSRSGASPFGCMTVTRRASLAELGCSTVTRRTNESESDSGSGGSGGSTSWEITLIDPLAVSDSMARLPWYGDPPWPEIDGCALTGYIESAYGWGLLVGQDPNSLLTGQQIACHVALHAIEVAIATAPGGPQDGYSVGLTFWGFSTQDPTPKSMQVKADALNCDPTDPTGDSDVAMAGYATLVTAVCAP